jgi:hypothetical protein
MHARIAHSTHRHRITAQKALAQIKCRHREHIIYAAVPRISIAHGRTKPSAYIQHHETVIIYISIGSAQTFIAQTCIARHRDRPRPTGTHAFIYLYRHARMDPSALHGASALRRIVYCAARIFTRPTKYRTVNAHLRHRRTARTARRTSHISDRRTHLSRRIPLRIAHLLSHL